MGDGEFHPGFVINQPSAFQLSELFKHILNQPLDYLSPPM